MDSKEQILNGALNTPTETVTVPSWGGDVTIRAINPADKKLIRFANAPLEVEVGGNGRRRFEEPSEEEKQARRIVGKVILGVVADDGSQFWDWSDADELRDGHWSVVMQLAIRIQDLTDRVTAQNTLEAAKND